MTVINIHNLVTLEIDQGNPWELDIVSSLGDVPMFSMNTSERDMLEQDLPGIRVEYVTHLHRNGSMRPLSPDILISPTSVLDWQYRVKLARSDSRTLKFVAENACLEWLVWGCQLALLQSDATFVHAAGIVKGGRTILFPSWGGVGKTALVGKFVRELGWKLLGDDLVILKSNGECLGYPKPMVLYPYHKAVFPDLFVAGRGPIAPQQFNHLLSQMARLFKPMLRLSPTLLQYARRKNPQSVRVKPSEVFGKQSLAVSAPLEAVVWLDRVSELSESQMVTADRSLASRLIGSTLHELDSWCHNVINVACGVGLLASDQIIPKWQQIVESGLADSAKRILYIPSDVPIDEVSNLVVAQLERENLL
jgi:hypothetical protein